MKRTALIFLMVATTLASYSQSSKVVSAFNYHRYGKLDQAKEAIDEAVQHEKTIGDAKAWFYRGNIYLDIANSTDEKFRALDPDPLGVAYDSYQKASKLDEKGEYKVDIAKNTSLLAESYYNIAVVDYNLKNFKGAAEKFQRAFEVNMTIGYADTTALYNAAVAASFGSEDAMAKDLYQKLLAMKYYRPDIYSSLAEVYKMEGDTAFALQTIQKGREMFPEDFNLLIAETNIYLATSEKEKAMRDLEKALEIDATNPSIFFAVGTIYDQMGDFEKAESAYKQAILLNPEYFEANYNIGALYVNEAADIQDKANDLPLEAVKEYEIEKAKADEMLKTSIPYLEKALQLNTEDVNAMISLKEIYTRLGMTEKLQKINEMLGQ